MLVVRHRTVGQVVAAGLVAAMLLAGAPAWAQAATRVVAVLQDGTRAEGTLVSATRGQQVIVELPGGERRTIAWSELRELTIAGAAAASISPPMSAPNRPAPAPPASGACPEGEECAGQQVKEKTHLGTDGARYESEADCAQSSDERCTERLKLEAGKQLSLNYSRESIKRVKRRSGTVFTKGVAANALVGAGEGATLLGAGGSVSGRLAFGGTFPGEEGGTWLGGYLEPLLALHGMAISAGDTSSTSGMFMVQASAGVQCVRFDRLDPKTLTQGGLGVAVGASAGVQAMTAAGSEAAPTYGPQLSVIMPKYNPGTTQYQSTQVNLFVLPTKGFIMALLGLQYSFE
jgi:hypothetical protein